MDDFINDLLNAPENRITLVDLEISGNPKSLSFIRRILGTCSCSIAVPAAVLNDIKLAVSEACTNVIKHAFHYDPAKKFTLNLQVSPKYFLVRVVYQDGQFNPHSIPHPDFGNIKEGGLGVFIMRNIMDRVEYLTDPKTGTINLRMVKIIDPAVKNGGTP